MAGQDATKPMPNYVPFLGLQHELERATAKDESLVQTELLQKELYLSQASKPLLHPIPATTAFVGGVLSLTFASYV